MSRRPKRSLGQNFLVDPNIRDRIVEEVRVEAGETIVEVGPGRGALSDGLARAVEAGSGRLILVEVDDDLAADLATRYSGNAAVELVHGSILDYPLTVLSPEAHRVKVVGNIPYNLTSPILFHLLQAPRPREVVLMVQREVADRICAVPGTRAYGALTVGVQTLARVEKLLHVSPGAFRPRPNVDSTVLRILPIHPALLDSEEEGRLRALTRALFQWRRKQMGKILRDHPELELGPDALRRVLAAAGAAATDRPETVGPEGFVAMARALAD